MVPAIEAGHGMKRAGSGSAFRTKHLQNFRVQGALVPFVGFIQIDRDLDCGLHNPVNS
jgi:hypothetical protein